MEEYQKDGYFNYETWLVALWLDNDRSSYEYWREQARQHWKSAPTNIHVLNGIWCAENAAAYSLGEQIREELEEAAPLKEDGLFSGLLDAAMNEVIWDDVAEKFLKDVKQSAADAQGDETPGKGEEARRGNSQAFPEKRQEMEDNGWTNYKTWLVWLWFDIGQGSYQYWRDQAREHWNSAPTCKQALQGIWTAKEAATYNLADQMKEKIENDSPLKDADLFSDLLNAALSEVDWQEVAEKFILEFKKSDAARQREVIPVESVEACQEGNALESESIK